MTANASLISHSGILDATPHPGPRTIRMRIYDGRVYELLGSMRAEVAVTPNAQPRVPYTLWVYTENAWCAPSSELPDREL